MSLISVCSVFLLLFVFVALVFKPFKKGLMGILSLSMNKIYASYKSSALLHSFGRMLFDRSLSSKLPHLKNIEKVSTRVYRVLGLNPGAHTLQGTNTWLITGKTSSRHILVDTGDEVTSKEYISLLFDEVFPATGTTGLDKILLTHGHGDHQGGVVAILNELRARDMLPLPTVHKRRMPGGGDHPERGFECVHIEDGEVIHMETDPDGVHSGDTTTIEAIYTPGHTDDHVAFVIREDEALLSGDCVLGCGTAVFDDLAEYMASLCRIRLAILDCNMNRDQRVRDGDRQAFAIARIYPGHGPVVEQPLDKIDEYIRHRDAREMQILRALQRVLRDEQRRVVCGEGDRWLSTWELVRVVYGPLPLLVRASAQHNLTHHLHKLQREGKVVTQWPEMWSAVDAGTTGNLDFKVE